MGIENRINIVTKHLLLEKEKSGLELERFINSDTPIDELTAKITRKINKYRDSISNLTTWLDFVNPINEPVKGDETNKQ